MSALATALLAELSDADVALLAARLAPYLERRDDGQLLTAAEASARLGIHPKTLTRAAAAGRVIGSERVGRAWRFRAGELALEPPANAPVVPPAPRRSRSESTRDAANAIRNGGGTHS